MKRTVAYALLGVGLLLILMLLLLAMSDGGRRVLGLYTLNHHGIVFYGKLEDQFGNALADVPVYFDVRVHNGFRSGVDRGSVVTDKKGFFEVSGYSGVRLSVMPRLEGYAIASENGGGVYSDLWPPNERAHPDPNKPVIIKMWKAQGAEPLVAIGKRYKLPFTNAPLSFDLLTGTVVPKGGDIRLTVNRPPGIISERNPQVWSVTFDVVDGGFLDAAGTQRITYFAPESGYKTSETIFSTNRLPNSGIDGFGTGFYVKSRHGQVHAKLGVKVRINGGTNDPMYIEFSGVANTNYSRNWEGAPGTYLNPN
jgi:hypothetical protein